MRLGTDSKLRPSNFRLDCFLRKVQVVLRKERGKIGQFNYKTGIMFEAYQSCSFGGVGFVHILRCASGHRVGLCHILTPIRQKGCDDYPLLRECPCIPTLLAPLYPQFP
jgi:hypothetical protein